MHAARLLLVMLFGALLHAPVSALADDTVKAKPAETKKEAAAKLDVNQVEFTAEREAAALTFVRQHHAELAELLASLKQMKPKDYQRAIVSLFVASERLAVIKASNPARFEIELEAWQLNSRLQLLAARATMSSDPGRDAEVRELLEKQVDNRLARLKLDRAQATERLNRINSNLEQAQESRDSYVERQFQLLMRSSQRARGKALAAEASDSAAIKAATSQGPGAIFKDNAKNTPAKKSSTESKLNSDAPPSKKSGSTN